MSSVSSTDWIKTVSVIGLGYIGLPTAAILASRKVQVLGVDVNQKVIDTINQGQTHFIEPELDMVVHACVTEGFLKASNTPSPADVFIITVPTPLTYDKKPDLSYVKKAAESIAPVLKQGDLVILESTSPVGTTEKVAEWILACRPDLKMPMQGENGDIHLAYCPERVMPGQVLHELVHNDRIIGGITDVCAKKAESLYQLFVDGECIQTTPRTAELCKLTENSFRDVNIAFANELSMICDSHDINVWELIDLANRHPRVNVLKPGAGVGGHCIAVDPWFIVSGAPDDAKIIKLAREVNDYKPEWVVAKIKSLTEKYLALNPHKSQKDITIACLGLTFKPDIDDLRESPAVEIIKLLSRQHSGPILAVEPHVHDLPEGLNQMVELTSIEKVLQESDLVVKLVGHKQFDNVEINNFVSLNSFID